MALLVSCGACATMAQAGLREDPSRTPRAVARVLIDHDLNQKPVRLVGFDGVTLSILDVGGLVRREPASSYLAILTPGPVSQAAPIEHAAVRPSNAEIPGLLPWSAGEPARADLLTLSDGQRFPGRPAPASAQDTLAWDHPLLGVFPAPLDRVARVDVAPSEDASDHAEDGGASDRVTLANGDLVRGFVVAIDGPGGVEVETGSGADKRTLNLAWAQVRSVVLASAPTPLEGAAAWLSDGTVFAIAGPLTGDGATLELRPALAHTPSDGGQADAPAKVPLAAVAALAFESRAIRPLSALEPREDAGARAGRGLIRRSGAMQPLGAGDVELPRPMTVSWTLPDGAERFATGVSLPPDCWTWGDAELVVLLSPPGGTPTELARRRVSPEEASFRLNVPLNAAAGATLTIRLDEGRFGPIQDRVVLVRPLLKVPSGVGTLKSPPPPPVGQG